MDAAQEAFLRRCAEAAKRISQLFGEGANVLVVGHNDADALSSLGIFCGTASLLDATYVALSVPRIEEVFSDEVYRGFDAVVFVDMGSGYLNLIGEKVSAQVIVLDHHKPLPVSPPPNVLQVNPHDFGIDGSTMVSASGVTYLVCRSLTEDAKVYSPVAVVGALGDLQDKDHGRKLVGLNEVIVKEAEQLGLMKVEEDLILYGKSFRPVHEALASTNSPFLPGITGNETAALNLVLSAGIEPRRGDVWRTISDLSVEEKASLIEALASHLSKVGAPPTLLSELTGNVYELIGEEPGTPLRDGREYATLLNACGKTGNTWIGISVAMGSRGWVMREAERVLAEYRASVARAMEFAMRRDVREEMRYILVLRGGTEIDPRQISSVASILSSSNLLPPDKPLIALAQEGGLVKVSARASSQMVELGLDLGEVMRVAAERVGGRGGGHKMAAGAEFPADRTTLFLVEVDSLVGEVMAKARAGKQLRLV
jgi:RecJ-like exonuclease